MPCVQGGSPPHAVHMEIPPDAGYKWCLPQYSILGSVYPHAVYIEVSPPMECTWRSLPPCNVQGVSPRNCSPLAALDFTLSIATRQVSPQRGVLLPTYIITSIMVWVTDFFDMDCARMHNGPKLNPNPSFEP